MIVHERGEQNDGDKEDHIRLVAKSFVKAIKGLPEKKAENLAYEAIKLLHVAVEYIKIYRKK